MRRVSVEARPNWQKRIEDRGLVYWPTATGQNAFTGKTTYSSYWGETAFYEFDEPEIDVLHRAAELVLQALVAAGDHVLKTRKDQFINGHYLDWMQLPRFTWPAMKHTWDMEHPVAPTVYGRFDVRFGDGDHPKFLEYNADTPTSLLEAAVIQWDALEDRYGDAGLTPNSAYDQWNSIHEMLIAQWAHLQGYFRHLHGRLPMLHFMCAEDESGEDRMNAEYMREVARQAGWDKTEFLFAKQLRYDKADKGLWQYNKAQNWSNQIQAIFKLYPWEWIAEDEWGGQVFRNLLWQTNATTWIEPPYKMLLSNKGIWAVAWELFGNDSEVGQYLLPTFFSRDKRAKAMTDYAEKPVMGREGAGVKLVRDGKMTHSSQNTDYSKLPTIRQGLAPLPEFYGKYPVLGFWMCGSPEGDLPAGLGIRESDDPITGNGSTFVPHRFVKAGSGLQVPIK